MLTWAGPVGAVLLPDEPEEAAGVPVLEADPEPDELDPGVWVCIAGVPVLEEDPEPDDGIAVAMAVGVLDAPPEELLDEGLVGQRLLPVTGTTGVVVPLGVPTMVPSGVPVAAPAD